MNTLSKTLLLVSATYLLSGASLTLAETQGAENAGQATTRVVMENGGGGGRSEGQAPAETRRGSIRLTGDDEATLAAAAKIGSIEAATIAEQAHPGTVVETKLDTRDGYLVWKVELVAADKTEVKLLIDAGDGQVLATRTGHEDDDQDDIQDERRGGGEGKEHSKWKFWEDSDRDDGNGHED